MLKASLTAVGVLMVVYLALIAVVMTYAASTIAFNQSVRTDEAIVSELEAEYLDVVSHITSTDYAAVGYAKPSVQVFVRTNSKAALR